jgi:hypothetical protein
VLYVTRIVLAIRAKIWGNKLTTEQFAGIEEHNALNGVCVDRTFPKRYGKLPRHIHYPPRRVVHRVESPARRPASYTGNPWSYSVRPLEGMRELGGLKAVCRCEDLVADPKKTLSNLCDTLGLSYHEGGPQEAHFYPRNIAAVASSQKSRKNTLHCHPKSSR